MPAGETIGERVAQLMVELEFNSAPELADAIGATIGTVNTWLKNQRDPQRQHIIALARVRRVRFAQMQAYLEQGADLPTLEKGAAVAIPARARARIGEWARRNGLKEEAVIARIFNWWAEQPDWVQLEVLGFGGDRAPAIAKWMLQAMAAEGGEPPPLPEQAEGQEASPG